jgi:tetratricopeptide (TPR) repeat protein
MTPQDQEDLRWYLEDFLQYPQDPAPAIAARVEGRMAEVGTQLFASVFQANDDARDLWAQLRPKLNETAVEVSTSVEAAAAIPWELIRDPKTDEPLALRAPVFVRSQPQAVQRPQLPKLRSGPIRILLVICRPGGDSDVPFRSVASQLLKGISEEARATYQLDVLRPPTFEQLADVLRRAKSDRKPYHAVHFDGHGIYADLAPDEDKVARDEPAIADWLKLDDDLAPDKGKVAEGLKKMVARVLSGLRKGKVARDEPSILDRLRLVPDKGKVDEGLKKYLSGPRTGKHGYLLFEDPKNKENTRFIDGTTVGKLLVETGVPVLMLNACRSAHAEAPTAPEQAPDDNPHAQVRAFGSLAQEVMDTGVAGIVAMRYNVYVVTAAQFVAELYAALVRGQTLGAAVTTGRKSLHANPDRTIAYDPRPLQDWCVPVAYEAAPIRLFQKKRGDGLTIVVHAGESSASRGSIDTNLPHPPDTGFFGRDETLLALDRAFDTQSVVLLHAYAGSGKTATAAEFARWYSSTGGVDGPVLFTSFERHTPLPRVLDRIGDVFGASLEKQGVHWLALDDARRRAVALQVLKQIPVLWVWDNVEPVAGFPKGTASAWSPEEQRALADFLREARSTQAKFLLTSRRDEQEWLGDLPRRVKIGPMPMQERVQLARALAEKRGRRLTDVSDWRPLLRFTGGNPLTIIVLVGQALRDGLTTKQQIEDFEAKLRFGEVGFRDEASEGRTRSLGASLAYGFEHAFTDAERKQLALLHLFQGFVDVGALRYMGRPTADSCLPEVRGLTREAAIALLDRAAEVGLLTPLGNGAYSIHPAVPWFFKNLFDLYYAGRSAHPSDEPPGRTATHSLRPVRAFVEAIGELGNFYKMQYEEGRRAAISALAAEEANLLYARNLARRNGWWDPVIRTMTGLQTLYDYEGRQSEWRGLVDEIVPDFVDPATDGPIPGREEGWKFVTEYRVKLARNMRDLARAERLERACVEWARRDVEGILKRHLDGTDQAAYQADVGADSTDHPASSGQPKAFRDRLAAVLPSLTQAERIQIRSLAVSLQGLGHIQREGKESGCIASYEEALELGVQIGDRAFAASCAFNMGTAYETISDIRDLDQAEIWYRHSLEFRVEDDRLGRARSHAQLSSVAIMRLLEAQSAEKPVVEQIKHIHAALSSANEALGLTPDDAVNELAFIHDQLGQIYGELDDFDRALRHYRDSIRFREASGDRYGAAHTRFSVATDLAQRGRFSDALEYARTARAGFSSFGSGAAGELQQTQELIHMIEEDLAAQQRRR